jgi:hypothetical protein
VRRSARDMTLAEYAVYIRRAYFRPGDETATFVVDAVLSETRVQCF